MEANAEGRFYIADCVLVTVHSTPLKALAQQPCAFQSSVLRILEAVPVVLTEVFRVFPQSFQKMPDSRSEGFFPKCPYLLVLTRR
jgi:hypothetical protein